ncbi:MAG: hypothetical protein JSU92_05275 [Deltaproteobacteria bacterium]|nr:MAG: hypothetical protein JSU92_05275 [Deltaproteobacteria bacterium]
MPRALAFICWYYFVIFILSIVQLILILKLGYPFVLGIFPVYYMTVRIAVMIVLLAAWIIQLRTTLLWSIVCDSVIMIFGNLYLSLAIVWPLLERFSWERVFIHIKYSGFHYVLIGVLTIPGIVILAYVLRNFLEIAKPYGITMVDMVDTQKEKEEERKAVLYTLGKIRPDSFWRDSSEEG